MRAYFLLLGLFLLSGLRAQHLDPDQLPYWTRYTIVEDSSALVPLKGDYAVHYLQSGMWWTMIPPRYPIGSLPEKSMRLLPLFGKGLPPFQATPARGKDLPEVRLVVVREQDTMVVELSSYFIGMGGTVDNRCKDVDCTRRPPVVLPFRPGRFIGNGAPYGPNASTETDARTTMLTQQFDSLWNKAMADERVIPQLNTDTCRQEVYVPEDLDRPETTYRDAWLLRSAYCGTHFAHFPSWGTGTEYLITFNPYLPHVKKDPVSIHLTSADPADGTVDVTDWPIGDHTVRLLACGNGGSFTLKFR